MRWEFWRKRNPDPTVTEIVCRTMSRHGPRIRDNIVANNKMLERLMEHSPWYRWKIQRSNRDDFEDRYLR